MASMSGRVRVSAPNRGIGIVVLAAAILGCGALAHAVQQVSTCYGQSAQGRSVMPRAVVPLPAVHSAM